VNVPSSLRIAPNSRILAKRRGQGPIPRASALILFLFLTLSSSYGAFLLGIDSDSAGTEGKHTNAGLDSLRLK
jgi:hypothetical protein